MSKVREFLSDGRLAILLIAAILIIDQIIKIAVKSNMCLGESIHVTDWFFIEFIENSGMAYGMTFFNKLALSLFRIVLVSFIGFYIYKLVKLNYKTGYVMCLSLIMAGAAGNILDSMFYGLMFDESTPFSVSQLVPFGTGYAPFLHGKVVDMFYFPIIVTTWPDWIPFCGGEEFVFFSPVFNFADSCISVGAVLLVLFYRNDLETLNTVFVRNKVRDDDVTDSKGGEV